MIPLFTVNMPETVDKPLLDVLHSGYITQGPKVEEFEKELKRIFGTPYALTVNSGTSALTLALRLADVGPDDEVITTPMTCSATNLPILSLGAKPVWADVDPRTGLLKPASVLAKITGKTKAIMVVDWGGAEPELEALAKIAHDFGIKLIEDSAHSFAALHTLNSPADFVCFSLQAIKHITTGDGGVLLCNDRWSYERARRLRWFGISREAESLDSRIDEDIEEWGYKFHMNDLAATIGIEQLKLLPFIKRRHQEIATIYRHEIDPQFYIHPPIKNAYWLYTLLLPNSHQRDRFKVYMSEQGIQVSEVHRRNDRYKVFRPYSGTKLGKWHPYQYVGVDAFSERMVCIPVHRGLSNPMVVEVVKHCNRFAKEATG